jgi:hypothetical protein
MSTRRQRFSADQRLAKARLRFLEEVAKMPSPTTSEAILRDGSPELRAGLEQLAALRGWAAVTPKHVGMALRSAVAAQGYFDIRRQVRVNKRTGKSSALWFVTRTERVLNLV